MLVSLARRAYHFQQLAFSFTPFHECRTYYLKLGGHFFLTTVGEIECGKVNITLEKAYQLAAVFECDVRDLLP